MQRRLSVAAVTAVLAATYCLTACGDSDSDTIDNDESSGDAAADANDEGAPSMTGAGSFKLDLPTGPRGDMVTDAVDANGCYDHCMYNQDPRVEIPVPECSVQAEIDGVAVEVPPCLGSTPDDFATPEGSALCFWYLDDGDEVGLTSEEWDDVPTVCRPTNVSFGFAEAEAGLRDGVPITATCFVADSISPPPRGCA